MGRGTLDEQFDAYEATVKRYGYSWFRQDAPATAVSQQNVAVRARVNRLSAGLQTVGTEAIYRTGGRWVADRVALQEKVVAEALLQGGLGAAGDDRDAVPQAVLLMGLPGSGKSSLLRPVAAELIRRTSDTSHVIVDADVVRGLFPEYAGGLGSEVIQPETSSVANGRLLDEVFFLRANIILDKVGDPESSVAAVEYLLSTGWSVWCLCATIDVEVAVERAKRRAIDSGGRYVPPDVIRRYGDKPRLAYEAVRDSRLSLSGSALLDTAVPLLGRPRVVEANTEDLFGSPGSEVAVWPIVPTSRGDRGDEVGR
ncbi:MAG: zeta toxin family protein [Acidimicrobiales bacterium]